MMIVCMQRKLTLTNIMPHLRLWVMNGMIVSSVSPLAQQGISCLMIESLLTIGIMHRLFMYIQSDYWMLDIEYRSFRGF